MDALSRYGRAVWVWTRCLGMGGLSGYGRAVWVWACCLGLGGLSGYGHRRLRPQRVELRMKQRTLVAIMVSSVESGLKSEVEPSYRVLQRPTGTVLPAAM